MNEVKNNISELRITIGKAKACAEAFGEEFVDPYTVESRVLAVQAAPNRQQYLYAAIQDLLDEAEQRIIALEKTG